MNPFQQLISFTAKLSEKKARDKSGGKPGPRVSPWKLTKNMAAIYDLHCDGVGPRQIARQLEISRGTVDYGLKRAVSLIGEESPELCVEAWKKFRKKA